MKLSLRAICFVSLALTSCYSMAEFQKGGISISLGGAYTSVDSRVGSTLIGDDTRHSGTIDFESNLLLEDSSTQPVFELDWTFKERHSLSLNYFELDRSGTKFNTADVDLGDVTFKAGYLLNSRLDLSLWQFKYAYSIYQTKTMAAGMSLGLHVIDFDMSFNGIVAAEGEGDEAVIEPVESTIGVGNTIPLPNIGFYYHYLLTDDFYLNVDAQYFAIKLDIPDVADIDAGMLALDIGAEYYPWQQFSIYVGMSYYDVYATVLQDFEVADIEWDVQLEYWGPKIVAKYTF